MLWHVKVKTIWRRVRTCWALTVCLNTRSQHSGRRWFRFKSLYIYVSLTLIGWNVIQGWTTETGASWFSRWFSVSYQGEGSTAIGAAAWQTARGQQQNSTCSPEDRWRQRSQSEPGKKKRKWNYLEGCFRADGVTSQTNTHSAETGDGEWDRSFKVIRTLQSQSGDEAGGCSDHTLETDQSSNVVEKHWFII